MFTLFVTKNPSIEKKRFFNTLLLRLRKPFLTYFNGYQRTQLCISFYHIRPRVFNTITVYCCVEPRLLLYYINIVVISTDATFGNIAANQKHDTWCTLFFSSVPAINRGPCEKEPRWSRIRIVPFLKLFLRAT